MVSKITLNSVTFNTTGNASAQPTDKLELKEMFLDWAPDLQSALDRVLPDYDDPLVTVLPRAVSMIPRVTE